MVEVANLSAGKEIEALQEEITKSEDRISKLRREIDELSSEEVRHSTAGIYKFAGKIQNVLGNIQKSISGLDKESDLAKKKERVEEIKDELKELRSDERYSKAITKINDYIREYAAFMQLEGHNKHIYLDMKTELNLAFYSGPKESRVKDMLWEIGSGANWMGYHLCTYLGLHRYFHEVGNTHISSFIVIDQPSQVYFPADTYETNGKSKSKESHEIKSTRKIFELLNKFITDVNKERQIIVLEHADKTIYGPTTEVNLGAIHEVENWHSEEKDSLIPKAWLT